MQTVNSEKPILVTGASGYIASWLVQQLLEAGFTVHGTVRNPSDTRKVGHLEAMQEAFPGQLKLFSADLLVPGSFTEAMADCQIVMHTASPVIFGKIKAPQKQLVDPALLGTQNVLNTANATPGVERVVLTSSVVSTYGDAVDVKGAIITEDLWNTTSTLHHQPYNYSKTVAEKRAWEMQMGQDRWDLVVINPGFVLGPSLNKRSDGVSTSILLGAMRGDFKMGVPNQAFGVVDVRDVAKAHLIAGTQPSASGRHIAVEKTMTMAEIIETVNEYTSGKYPISTKLIPKFLMYLFGPSQGFTWKMTSKNYGLMVHFDNSYIQQDLGLEFQSVHQAILDQVDQLVEDGLAPAI